MQHVSAVIFVWLLSFTPILHAEESEHLFQLSAEVTTTFPLFVGAGVAVTFEKHYQLDAIYGFTPASYYQVIGSVAANLGGNAAYKDVIDAAFQNNSLWRVGLQYNFDDTKRGWRLGIAASSLSSSGQASIEQVLATGTGENYSQLEKLLTAAGKSTNVEMQSNIFIAEIQAGYAWEIANNLILSANLGIAKVMSSSVQIDTGLPSFEASPFGNAQISSSENYIEATINQYGITPTLAVSILYTF